MSFLIKRFTIYLVAVLAAPALVITLLCLVMARDLSKCCKTRYDTNLLILTGVKTIASLLGVSLQFPSLESTQARITKALIDQRRGRHG